MDYDNFGGASDLSLVVDTDFEREQNEAAVWVGDGYFIDTSWGEGMQVVGQRPAILHTLLRENGLSYAHDRHPFVAFVHLLAEADVASAVYVSVPFLSDVRAIDQFCHFASPQHENLQIYIILGPARWNVENLENFIDFHQDRETSVNRLHIKRFGRDANVHTSAYSHSKAMVSSAGVMIGSFNLTNTARLRHREHSILLSRDDDSDECNGVEEELKTLWDEIESAELVFRRRKTALEKAAERSQHPSNPYAKKQKT